MEGGRAAREGSDCRVNLAQRPEMSGYGAVPPTAGLPQNLRRGRQSLRMKPQYLTAEPLLTEQREVWNEIRAALPKSAWACRDNGATIDPSSWSMDRIPWGKSGPPTGSWVINRNAGTRVWPPVGSRPASRSESGEGRTRGQSSRSSPRPGKPVTWRRGTGVRRFAEKGK